MNTSLYIVVDVSGSMSDGGKRFISRGVARAIAQYIHLDYGRADLKLVAWSKEARVVDWTLDSEFPREMLVCEKAANAEALITLLGKQLDNKILLITDGFWAQDEAKAINRWKKNHDPNTLRIIKIGADANPRLKGQNVFSAEDLFVALDGWLEGIGA